MARQKGDLVSGKIGTIIYYVRNGKQYARYKGPDHIKQTEATKASAGKFGQASQTAKTIRTAFEALEPLCDLDRIPYKGSVPAQDIELPVSAASNMMSAVIAGIRHVYMIGGDGRLVLEEDTKWMSACVLEAVYRKD